MKKKRVGSKKKGTKAERELFHLFWENGWGCARVAGSGSSKRPSTDLIASNGLRTLALECKAIKTDKKYFDLESINQMFTFSRSFGAEAWIAMRFDKIGWFFVELEKLKKSKGKSSVVSLDFAKKKGRSFEELLGIFEQKRLINKPY